MPDEKGIWTQEEADRGHLFSEMIAKIITRLITKKETIYDFGCGNAAYVKYLQDKGFEEVYGIEGRRLLNSLSESVFVQDLTEPFELQNKGNVICLEVAEHIPEEYESVLLDNIEKHIGKDCFLIISWAIPGQEGIGHVNCQSNDYVIAELEHRGFTFRSDITNMYRGLVEDNLAYFKDTLMFFSR